MLSLGFRDYLRFDIYSLGIKVQVRVEGRCLFECIGLLIGLLSALAPLNPKPQTPRP